VKIVSDDFYHDDPVEKKSRRILNNKFLTSIVVVIAAAFFFQSTLAANLSINSGQSVEFGQGIAVSTVCDSTVTLTPYSSFVNGSSSGTFYFSAFQLSNIDAAACSGVTFTIKAYNNSSSSPLTLFSTNTSASIKDSNSTFEVAANQSGLSLADSQTAGSFTASFTSPAALSSDVYKITVETSGNPPPPNDNGSASLSLNTTFSKVGSSDLYPSIASASAGSRLYAVSGNSVHISTDTGTTWSTTSLPYPSMSIVTSANGMTVAAAGAYGRLYLSTDGGVSWNLKYPYDGYSSFEYMTMSQNGSSIFTSDGYDAIFPSTNNGRVYKFTSDSGTTWQNIQRASIESAYAVAMKSDASTLYVAHYNGQIWKSNNNGSTWNVLSGAGSRYWKGFAVSGNGSYILGAAHNDFVYLSSDGGTNWNKLSTPISSYWQTASMTSDGRVMAVASANGDIYASVDYGLTWSEITGIGTGSNYWYSSAISSDGKYLFLGKYSYGSGDSIYKIAIPGA
jgi:photosystem II stability/assembly factor-like uncharacterized protein